MLPSIPLALLILAAAVCLQIWLQSLQLNTASFSVDVQAWRAQGKIYVYNFSDHNSFAIFYQDVSLPKPAAVPDPRCGGSQAPGCQQEPPDRTLLLIHGFPTSSFDWTGDFWTRLTQPGPFLRIIALDCLGFGLSDKPRLQGFAYPVVTQADIVEGLLRHVNAPAVHILAHDLGDTIAQELLARQADGPSSLEFRVLSVGLLNGGIFPELHRPLLQQTLLASRWTGPLLAPLISRASLSRALGAVFGPGTQPSAAFVADAYALLQYNGGHALLQPLLGYMQQRWDNRERWVGALVNHSVPLILINGPADPISGRHAAQRFQELVPDPNIVLLPDAIGHYPQVEAPDLVWRAYNDFVTGLAS